MFITKCFLTVEIYKVNVKSPPSGMLSQLLLHRVVTAKTLERDTPYGLDFRT
jgi:hypothetical protein